MVEALSKTRCTSRSAGTSASNLRRNAENSVAGVQRSDDLAARQIQGGVKAGGAVADVVFPMLPGTPARASHDSGWVRLSAWIWVFSSIRARMVRPTISSAAE
jgi:hypothetical protein